MIIADAPDEMTMVDVIAGWEPDDRTLLYDPKFCFPPETLLALARAHACCPDLVYHERRRHKDSDAFAYVFGLGALASSIVVEVAPPLRQRAVGRRSITRIGSGACSLSRGGAGRARACPAG